MKVVFVVDSLTDIQNKINMFKQFEDKVLYVVRSPFEQIIRTYGITPNAIYSNNLAKIIHMLLVKTDIEATLVYYSSLNLTEDFLAEFLLKIGDGSKVINAMPNYNYGEKLYNEVYNSYVKAVFKLKDSFASPKLQFLPMLFVNDLLHTHFGNRLFEVEPSKMINVSTIDKKINKSLKIKPKLGQSILLFIIIALAISALMITCIALIKMNFILIITFIALYILDIIGFSAYRFKMQFDHRFLK